MQEEEHQDYQPSLAAPAHAAAVRVCVQFVHPRQKWLLLLQVMLALARFS